MGYYNVGHNEVSAKAAKLREDWDKAKKRLDDYLCAIFSPPGCPRFESAIESPDTKESLEKKVQEAESRYLSYIHGEEYQRASKSTTMLNSSFGTKFDFFRR